jgi:hypothetical protein
MTDNSTTAIQAWLDEVEVKTDVALLTQQEMHDALELIGHPGMKVLLGLMIGSRQGCYVRLANAGLSNTAEAIAAAVIQGTIRGIDMLPNTLLELAVPAQAGEQEQQP